MHQRAEHIASDARYEMKMFQAAVGLYRKIGVPSIERDMALECMLLHARVLRDFICSAPKNDNDVSAAHFFDDPENWLEHQQSLLPYLKRERSDLNKFLAHLSYERCGKDKNWCISKIEHEMNEAIEMFICMLPDGRKEWFAI